jgi:hypothetical protein
MGNVPGSPPENNINVYTDSVTVFIRKFIEDVVPTVTNTTYPNHKLWIDGSSHTQKNRPGRCGRPNRPGRCGRPNRPGRCGRPDYQQ